MDTITIKQAKKLIKDAERKIQGMEYRNVRLKGVPNLSRADLDSAILYAEQFIASHGKDFGSLRQPNGSDKSLLAAYGVTLADNSEYGWHS